jgi:hypothetical protein
MLKLVIRLRAEGKSTIQIGEKLGVPDRTVRNWLAEASAELRAENRAFAAEMFTIHQQRCEDLYARVRKKLKNQFSIDLVKVALLILDRQSRLLGLDRAGRGNTPMSNDWLENATTQELIDRAKELGVPVPEKFDARSS